MTSNYNRSCFKLFKRSTHNPGEKPMRVALCVLCCWLLVLTVAPVQATESAPHGRIVFAATRTNDGNSDIFSTDFGGEAMVNLTNDPAPDRSPSWSPDGRQIVFAS